MKKGTIYVSPMKEYTAKCGLCEEEEAIHYSTKREAESSFRSGGWVKTKKHGWICFTCSRAEYGDY